MRPPNIHKENPDPKYSQTEQKGDKSGFSVEHGKWDKSGFHPENLALCLSKKHWEMC